MKKNENNYRCIWKKFGFG